MSAEAKTVDQLVEEALDGFDAPGATVAGNVRKAVRIASKRNDFVSLIRLQMELLDVGAGIPMTSTFNQTKRDLAALVGPERAKKIHLDAVLDYERTRRLQGEKGPNGSIHAGNIGQLEAMRDQVKEILDSFQKVPDNLTPVDTYFVLKDYDASAAKTLPVYQDVCATIERVKQVAHDFLTRTEAELASGQRRPGLFDRGREYIESGLQERAPDALVKFRAAEDALAQGTPESLAHALTSCRRMIKALADALYPATGDVICGEDGQERAMTDELYMNRILQFSVERLGDTHKSVVQEALKSLGNRLKRLNSLSSKGVHDEVSLTEAETCILWTYLTAADISRIADGTALASPQRGSGDAD